MTLTTEDLQAIQVLLQPLQEDMNGMKEDIYELKEDLHPVKEEIYAVKEEIHEVKEEIHAVKEDLNGIRKQITEINTRVSVIELTLENETNRNIMRVAEGHLDLSRKLNEAVKIASDIQARQEIQDIYLVAHDNKLKAL